MKTQLLRVNPRSNPRRGEADASYEVIAVAQGHSIGWVNKFVLTNVGERGGAAVEWWAQRGGEHYPYYFETRRAAVDQLVKAAS